MRWPRGGAARWRRWLADATRRCSLVYLGLLAALPEPPACGSRPPARCTSASATRCCARRAAAASAPSANWSRRRVQIMINTLSFARVGAFALAHAGLSSAIVALMDAADSLVVKALVLVLGNARRDRARGHGGLDPDHAPGAVRVLHPLHARPRACLPPAATTAHSATGRATNEDPPRRSPSHWLAFSLMLAVRRHGAAAVAGRAAAGRRRAAAPPRAAHRQQLGLRRRGAGHGPVVAGRRFRGRQGGHRRRRCAGREARTVRRAC